MTCRDISKSAAASYDTIQQMSVGLGSGRGRRTAPETRPARCRSPGCSTSRG
jgi:hypothetical protein